ncbi:MAG: UpxY family transcription antiterminator [Terracidiphilus sp.]
MKVSPALHESEILVPEVPTRNWFAVYVWSNQEKTIDRNLRMRGIETFLPLHTVLKRWKNRVTAKVEIPLFKGYVFVKIARAQCTKVLEVSQVHSIVGNGREALALPETDIETLRQGLQARQVDPYPYLKVGAMARIHSGPLTGMKGVVVRVNNQLRVVLSIDAIARSIAVHVTADELEICGPASP